MIWTPKYEISDEEFSTSGTNRAEIRVGGYAEEKPEDSNNPATAIDPGSVSVNRPYKNYHGSDGPQIVQVYVKSIKFHSKNAIDLGFCMKALSINGIFLSLKVNYKFYD